ncbi:MULTISPECIES: hypothetical protein [Xanthomonas]|uniref:Uncharacterized protein n=1 Tax=Xanthomonas sontii TaxID=2650745 RepID=A0A6N7QF29_9XANT|nr:MULTISPECIES: hypothetical protein [Xanthomonas]MRH00845.1 hypothetical protein [Xanthomonas sontii]MRH75211.1 hypothetical protein [Xanthomonas sontii]
MKIGLVLASLLLSTAALGVYASSKGDSFNLNASEVSDANNAVSAKEPLFFSKSGSYVSADGATFSVDRKSKGSWPYLIDLSGFTFIKGEDFEVSAANGGRYYPEMDAFVFSSFTQVSPMDLSVKSMRCTAGGQVQVTYSNGTVVTADKVCTSVETITCEKGQLKRMAASICS